ncbi:hypothetical protein [Aneurinibacillus aneurinilyticus]|uniref:hypothetical protein n=1 Tax=Aneurinibacillus aneurinilyticus TaxID=1391 RepID=UPI0035252965
MKKKKTTMNLLLSMAVLAAPATAFADNSDLLQKNAVETDQNVVVQNGSNQGDDGSIIVTPTGITQDTRIYASQAAGGRGSAEYEHYGNFKYDGRTYIKNIGNREFTYKLYTANQTLVYQGTLQPGKDVTLNLLQSVLKWNLSDGKGKVTIASPDGGTAEASFRYNVLD